MIDEAYNLRGNGANAYGSQVLDTIVEKIQGTPSDEFTQNALYLGSALGLVAFGLVAFTGLQSRRYRKKSKN